MHLTEFPHPGHVIELFRDILLRFCVPVISWVPTNKLKTHHIYVSLSLCFTHFATFAKLILQRE